MKEKGKKVGERKEMGLNTFLLKPCRNFTKQVLLFPLHQWVNWGLRSNFCQVTQGAEPAGGLHGYSLLPLTAFLVMSSLFTAAITVRWSPHRENTCYCWRMCPTLSSAGQCFSHPDCKRYSEEERNIQTVALRQTREKIPRMPVQLQTTCTVLEIRDVQTDTEEALGHDRSIIYFPIRRNENNNSYLSQSCETRWNKEKESATEWLIWAVRQLGEEVAGTIPDLKLRFREGGGPSNSF